MLHFLRKSCLNRDECIHRLLQNQSLIREIFPPFGLRFVAVLREFEQAKMPVQLLMLMLMLMLMLVLMQELIQSLSFLEEQRPEALARKYGQNLGSVLHLTWGQVF